MFPKVIIGFLGILFVIIGWLFTRLVQSKETEFRALVNNNTIAMESIVTAVASIAVELKEIRLTQANHGAAIARHDVQLSKEE